MSNKKVKGKKEIERLKNKFEKNHDKSEKEQLKEITNNAKKIQTTISSKTKEKINGEERINLKEKKSNETKEITSTKKTSTKLPKEENIIKKEKIKQEEKVDKKINITKDNKKTDEIKELKKEIIDNKKEQIKVKKSKKRIILVVILFILLLVFLGVLGYFLKEEHDEKVRLENLKKEKELVAEISSHYNIYVKTNKEALLYNSDNEVVGKLPVDTEISLKEITIDKNTKYFEISTFEGYFIKYDDVTVIDNLTNYDTRYKKYMIVDKVG